MTAVWVTRGPYRQHHLVKGSQQFGCLQEVRMKASIDSGSKGVVCKTYVEVLDLDWHDSFKCKIGNTFDESILPFRASRALCYSNPLERTVQAQPQSTQKKRSGALARAVRASANRRSPCR